MPPPLQVRLPVHSAALPGKEIPSYIVPLDPRIQDGACGPLAGHPRPMKGIFVAMMVMNCTFASNGRLAM